MERTVKKFKTNLDFLRLNIVIGLPPGAIQVKSKDLRYETFKTISQLHIINPCTGFHDGPYWVTWVKRGLFWDKTKGTWEKAIF